MNRYARRAALVAVLAVESGCLDHPEPDPDLDDLCERHGCDVDVPTLDELRDIFNADADGGVE